MSDAAESPAIDHRKEALKRDLQEALTLKELAWLAIQNGTDPKYVANRYGFSVEQMLAAKAEHERREAQKRERTQPASSDSQAP